MVDEDGAPVNIGLLVGHTFPSGNRKGRKDKYKPVTANDLKDMTEACSVFLEKDAKVSFE